MNRVCSVLPRLRKFLFVFIVIQPFLDHYSFFSENAISIMGVTFPTFIRFVYVLILALITFIIQFKKKSTKNQKIRVYFVLVIIYILLHLYFSFDYSDNVFLSTLFSFKLELKYIFQMLLVVLFFLISKYIDLSDYIVEITFVLVAIISGTIVLSNLTKTSLGSYTNLQVSYNIFQWFVIPSDQMGFLNMASKGFFRMANEISALLFLLGPIILYYSIYENSSFLRIIVLVLYALSNLMLGTRVALFSFIIHAICIFLYVMLFNREKLKINNVIGISLIFILYILILPNSPAYARHNQLTMYDEKPAIRLVVNDNSPVQIDLKEELLSKGVPESYISEYYPLKNDVFFWENMNRSGSEKLSKNRFLQYKMLSRVKERSDNPAVFTTLFGIGYSRMHGIYPLEMEFVSHYYTIGIFGLLLLMPQVFILILQTVKGVLVKKDGKRKRNNLWFLLSYSLFGFYMVSMLSGNVLDSLFVPLIVAYYTSVFCIEDIVK